MKVKVLALAAVVGGAMFAQCAFADVSSISFKFAGGCVKGSTGTCKVRASASGTELDSETFIVQTGATASGPWTNVTRRKGLSVSGSGSAKFKNADGCYRVKTGPNGNDKPDHHSSAKCEK